MSNALNQPIINTLSLYKIVQNNALRNIALVVLGSIFIGVCAHIQVPFWPVPVTMQSFAVITIAMLYGWKMGGATIFLYLVEGMIGLPVLASNIGIAAFTGPTAGYLIGFLIAGLCVGFLTQKSQSLSFLKATAIACAGTIIIFALGYAWLGYFYTLSGDMTAAMAYQSAFQTGVLLFIPGAIGKIILSGAILSRTTHYIRK